MSSPPEDERLLIWAAFNLGIMLTQHVYGLGDEPASSGNADRLMDTLREVAEGRLTLIAAAGELTAAHPDMDPEIREFIYQDMNDTKRQEREVARLLWGDYESAQSEPPEG